MLATDNDADEAEENIDDEANQFGIEEVVQQKSVHCNQCGKLIEKEKSVNIQLRDSSSKLSLLKKIVEIHEPLGVEYRILENFLSCAMLILLDWLKILPGFRKSWRKLMSKFCLMQQLKMLAMLSVKEICQ